MAIIAGIDPGINGAFSLLDTENASLTIHDMPYFEYTTVRTKKKIDPYTITKILKSCKVSSIMLEEIASSPQMGVVSAFSFGEGNGIILGVAAALEIPVTLVKPSQWKKTLRVPADKRAAVQRAAQLFPAATRAFSGPRGGVFDGRAESALLALLGALEISSAPKESVALQGVNPPL